MKEATTLLATEPIYAAIKELVDEVESTFKKGTCGQDIMTFSENKELTQECKHLGIKAKDCYSKLVALTVNFGKRRTDHWCVRACMCVHIYIYMSTVVSMFVWVFDLGGRGIFRTLPSTIASGCVRR